MKRREITASAIVFLLLVLSIPFAANSAPADTLSLQPDHDYTMNSANNVPGGADGDDLVVVGQVMVESCTATQESFLKFDLSSVATPITDAELLLHSNFDSVANTITMGVFTSNDETWNDGVGFTWDDRPGKVEATALASASKTPVNGDVVFSGAALAAALETQRVSGTNPKLVTLVITAVDCSGFSTTQSMDSRDKTAGVSPVLTLYFQPTSTPPTPTNTPTSTRTNTPTGTPTNTPTNTPTGTPTGTPTPRQTSSPTPAIWSVFLPLILR